MALLATAAFGEPIAPDALRVTSRGLSACRLKGNVRHLEVTLEPPREKRRWVAGVLLHADGQSDFSVALFDWGGHIRVHRYVNGSRQILAQGLGRGVAIGECRGVGVPRARRGGAGVVLGA